MLKRISICYMPEENNLVVAFSAEDHKWTKTESEGRFRVATVQAPKHFRPEDVAQRNLRYNETTKRIRRIRSYEKPVPIPSLKPIISSPWEIH